MTKYLFAAVSAMAMTISGASMAQTGTLNSTASAPINAAQKTPEASPELQQRLKNDLNRAADAVKDTYRDVKESVQASVEPADTPSFSDPSHINQRYSANQMIGKDVLNAEGKKIATVKDIIVEQNGRAILLVVQDGGLLGLGAKEAAFNYDVVVNRNTEGDVFVPLSQEQIAKATKFSYNPVDSDADVRRIPQGGYSVAQVMDSYVEDPSGKRVARVENVTFEGGHAQNLIVAFDTILGLGGKRASLDFQDVQLVRISDSSTRVRMNANQSAAFENFKQRQRQ